MKIKLDLLPILVVAGELALSKNDLASAAALNYPTPSFDHMTAIRGVDSLLIDGLLAEKDHIVALTPKGLLVLRDALSVLYRLQFGIGIARVRS